MHVRTNVSPRSSKPAVSIVLPLFNAGEYVDACLASLRAQTLDSWEAIVVDDGSTDHGPTTVEQAARSDPRIRLIQQTNKGVSAARNIGIEHARGETVLALDPDDLLAPNALSELKSTLDASGEAGAFGAYDVTSPTLETLHTYRDDRTIVSLDDLVDRAYVWTGAHLVRREAYDGVRFDETLIGYEDRDAWFRLAENGVRWAVTSETVAKYRIRPGSASKDAARMLSDATRVYRDLFDRAHPDLNASQERLSRSLLHIAIGYASRAAVLNPLRAHEYASMLFPFLIDDLNAKTLARAGQFAVIYGLGQRPIWNDHAQKTWGAGLRKMWSALEEAGNSIGTDQAYALLGEPMARRAIA